MTTTQNDIFLAFGSSKSVSGYSFLFSNNSVASYANFVGKKQAFVRGKFWIRQKG